MTPHSSRNRYKQRTELLSQQLIELTAQEEMADRYRSVDLEKLREWYRQAEASGKSPEYLSRIGEIGQTLRDWQDNSFVGWEKVQELNLDDIQQQMAIDKEEYQKTTEIQKEKASPAKVESKVSKLQPKQQKSREQGLGM